MGGELEKTRKNERNDSSILGKTINHNHKNKYQSIVTDDNPQHNRKNGSKSAMKTTNINNDLKRGVSKKKKEKMEIV